VTLSLCRARLADGRVVDVTCEGARIESVVGHDPRRLAAPGAVDVGDRLLLAALAEPHAHLDKALSADDVPNPAGDLAGAITAWRAHYPDLGIEDVAARAERAVRRMVAHGCTAIRTHVDVGAVIGLLSVKALREVRQQVGHLVDLQIVALVASPLTGVDGAPNRAALAAALAEGVDLVGGCPHLDPDPAALVSVVLDASRDAGIPADLHVDETLDPTMLSLATLAEAVIDRGHGWPVTASHCVSLGVQPPPVQAEVAALVAEAGIGVVALPQTNLFLQARDRPQEPPRGITAVAALQAAGVTVVAGADNLQDPFCTVGRGDPLETAALMVMAAHQTPEAAFEQVSGLPRRLLGLESVEVAPGSAAELVAIEAASVRDTVASASPSRLVVHRGRVVVDTAVTRSWSG
jgi:cytosine/creatinine deaminase